MNGATPHYLTPKQKQVLDFITAFHSEHGYAPSQQEIAKHFGFKSLGTVQNYLVRLQRQGLLEKSWNARRGMKVIPDPQPQMDGEDSAGISGKDAPGVSSRLTPRDQTLVSEAVALPLVGRVAAGRPIEAVESRETLDVPASMIRQGEHVVLKVAGDSMIEDGILDGDYVVIKKQPNANNGQTVVALVQNEATIKRFYQRGKRVELHPANPNYEPLIIESLTERAEEAPGFKIEGVLVGVIRRLE